MKWIAFLIVTLLSLTFGLLPEMGMYFLWNLVKPTTEFARFAMVALFLLGGGGLSFLFGFLAVGFWVTMTSAIFEVRRW